MPSSNSAASNGLGRTDTEVRPRPERRQFSAAYKLKILEETDKATEPGQIGSILRRERLYSSLLAEWRKQRKQAALKALSDQPAGRKPSPHTAIKAENARLQKQIQQLETRLKRAELLIEIQKKAAALLEIDLNQAPGSAANETP
jgi:transposase-like protein